MTDDDALDEGLGPWEMKFVAYFSYHYSCKHAVPLDFLLLRESLIGFRAFKYQVLSHSG